MGLLQRQPFHASAQQAQRLVVVFRQVIAGILMAELVNEQAHHVLGDALLEPVRAEPKFVEDQFAALAVGRAAQMMRRGAAPYWRKSIKCSP